MGETRAADIFAAEGGEYTDNRALTVSFGGSAGHLCPPRRVTLRHEVLPFGEGRGTKFRVIVWVDAFTRLLFSNCSGALST